MTMPEEYTVPQAASYLKVSEETVCRNIRSKRLKALASRNPMVHTPRCSRGLRQQLRSEDRPNTTVALDGRCERVCGNCLLHHSKGRDRFTKVRKPACGSAWKRQLL